MKNKNGISIFIVDDDKIMLAALKKELSESFQKFGVEIFTFESGELCREAIRSKNIPDVAIVDFHLDSKNRDAMNGVKIIDMIKKECPDTDVIMFTSEENADIAVRAMHHGAHDYVVKNVHMFRKLNLSIFQCIKLKELRKEVKKQRSMVVMIVAAVALIVGAVVSIQLFAPQLL